MSRKNILCFGDSNTWGFVPGAFDPETFYMERYSRDIRWTGVIQNILGDQFYIIEEGLNGRTTNIEYPDLTGRSGTSYLSACLYSHSPLNLVMIQLGVNDLKSIFDRDIKDIAKGINDLIEIIQGSMFGPDMQSPPKILLVSPPELVHEGYLDGEGQLAFIGGLNKSKEFDRYFSEIATKKDCHYVDLAPLINYSSIDGIHLDENGHREVGSILARSVQAIFKDQ
jgi:lysophospholipase L1-like esterase|tara:strand:- start:150 stop:824 length:675 start_codon:yes stop_codon:yes gene_type:complete